jgi:hypothetical protein
MMDRKRAAREAAVASEGPDAENTIPADCATSADHNAYEQITAFLSSLVRNGNG